MRTRSRSRSDVGLSRNTSQREADYRQPVKANGIHRRGDSQDSRGSAGSDRRAGHNSYRGGRTQHREGSADSQLKRSSPPRHHRQTERRDQLQGAPQGYTQRQQQPIEAQNPEVVDENAGNFENFPEISQTTINTLNARGITKLFPVQYMTFRRIMNHEDLMVRDLTGSGKTLGFCLPMVEMFRKERLFGGGKPLAMILAPTRELAIQISKELELLKHNPREYNVLTVYGGVDIYGQTSELRKGVDIFVGTTGRVKDHMERRNFDFTALRFAILDEADIMLNLGFKEDVEHIMRTIKQSEPRNLQALMFSATVPRWVHQIASIILNPGYSTLDLVSNLKNKTSRTVTHLAINVPYHNRVSALADILICYGGQGQSIIFTSTKAEANQLLLSEKIKSQIEVMHGDIAQNQREVTLKRFKEKKFQVLVATDVASRGLDIPSVDLVIQVEPPKDPETYIHRSGRTARAGRAGTCITFFTNKHKMMLQHIENKAGITMSKIGVPQPEQVIKASSMGIVEMLKEVNEKVIPLFSDAADTLILSHNGDIKRALMQTLALLSGHHKEEMQARSLLNGQEDCVTFEMTMEKPFYAVSLVWNILKRFLPEAVTQNIKGMRCYKDNTGAVFDVQSCDAQKFEDIFDHETSQKNVDFKVHRATALPELKEDQFSSGGYGNQSGGHFDNRGSRNMNNHNAPSQRFQQPGQDGGRFQGGQDSGRFQGGQQSYGNGGGDPRSSYQSRPQGQDGPSQGGFGGQQQSFGGNGPSMGGGRPQRDQSCSVFVGNLGECDQRGASEMLNAMGLHPVNVRVLTDDQGKPKGAAFVDFKDSHDYETALRYDGQAAPNSSRRLRINPAGARPGGR